jgi:methionyl-tRNA formyltransferase
MRLAILTTDTVHHAWFVQRLSGEADALLVLSEHKRLAPPFDTAHPFEAERDAHERALWFGGGAGRLTEVCDVRDCHDVNDAAVLDALAGFRPDLAVVFGTGRLRPPLIAALPGRLINLHGGDPEDYRGLDTHLWAVWHGDFAGLVTTLHHVDAELDTGAIIGQTAVPLARDMALHQLRAANTRACAELTIAALAAFRRLGHVPARPQRRKGRYYSFMPGGIKELCVRKFAAHTARLPQ